MAKAQQLITATGLVVWQAAYLPYGEAQVRINLVENNLRFPGQYFDVESGLHYNWNRYYDAQTGRYTSADPIGLQGGMNVYAYVAGNPINGVDKEGLRSWKCRRPVGGLPGDSTFPVFNHAYLCATDATKGGHTVCGSTTGANGSIPIIGGYGRPSNYPDGQYVDEGDYYHQDACREIFMPPCNGLWHYTTQDAFDKCIVKAIIKRTRPRFGIGPWGTDCQEWTDDTINECFSSPADLEGYKAKWGMKQIRTKSTGIQME